MKKLVIFSGLPGTGKSTLASRLARELRWPLLCIDDVVVNVPENADNEFWDLQITALLNLTERQLDLGLHVIVDSVFMGTDRHHAQELAQKYNARFLPIHVFVSDEKVWRDRVARRCNELDNPDVATWGRIQRQREGFRTWEPNTALFIDSLHSVDENFQQVLDFVSKDHVDLKPLSGMPPAEGQYHA
ncbi:MAG: ATP-binding protein [Kiloniellales bacterium]|nr:ATP-binding protein [Kiloniellales bacterium]